MPASERRVAKRVIGGIYSFVADRVYEPLVVRGTFRYLGGRLNELVLNQGARAAAAARGRPILDMPVGTGYFTTGMAREHDGTVVGTDIAAGMLVKTRRTAAEAGITNLVCVKADAHRLPFADAAFGAVCCWNGLPVIPGLDETLDELTRVLAVDGTMFVSLVTLPVGATLPRRARDHLPTMLRSARDVMAGIEGRGLLVTSIYRTRLAHVIEAVKD